MVQNPDDKLRLQLSLTQMRILLFLTAPFKVILFPTITFSCYLLYLIGFLFIKLFKLRYEYWRNYCMRLWGNLTIKLFSMEVRLEGSPPKPPFFLVSNHLSYLDIPIYSAFTDTTFVSKSEIKSWPIVGFMAKTLGIIFIDRTKRSDVKRVNNLIAENLNDRQGVVLFPEGTTSPGLEVLRFRPSLLQHAAESDIHVSYSSLRYETAADDSPAYKSVCWWGNKNMLKHLFILSKNRKIIVNIRFGEETLTLNDRKLLAEELHKKVTSIFEPVTKNVDEEFVPIQF